MANKKPRQKIGVTRSRGTSATPGDKLAQTGFLAKPTRRKKPVARQWGEADIQDVQRLLLSMTRLQALFIDETKPATLFGQLLGELLRLTDSAYGFIGEVLLSEEGQPYLKPHAVTDIACNEGTKAFMAEHAPTPAFRNLKTLFGHVMTTRKPVIANDPTNDSLISGLLPGHPPMQAFLGLPLFHCGVLTGMVGVSNRPGGNDKSMVAYLEPFLGTCAQLIEAYRSKRLRSDAEQLLRASEERFRVAMQEANDGFWDWDLCTNRVYFSERWKNMIGYKDHELANVYHEWESRLHPDDHARITSELTNYLQKQSDVYDVEFRLRKKDGAYGWIHARGKAVWDAEGCPVRMAGSHTDITERKREEMLHVAEKQTLELVAQGCPLQEVLTFLCRAIETHTAPMLSSIMLVTEEGSHLSAVAGPSLSDEYSRQINRIPIGPTHGSCGSAAYYRQPAIVCDIAADPLWNGVAHVALAHGLHACWSQPILSSTGTLLGTFAAYFQEPRQPQERDLRLIAQASHIAALAIEHARVSEALRESERRHRSVVAAMAEGVVIQGQDGRISSCNASACRILGLTEDEIVGRTSLDPRWRAIHEDGSPFPGDTHPTMATLGSGLASENVVMGVHRPDGSLAWISINTQPIMGDEGKRPEGVVASFRDITVQKQREAELKLFRTLLDQVTDSIEVTDPSSGRFLDGNRQSYESIGYTREELSAMGVPDIDPLVAQPVFQEYMTHLREADTPLRIESMRLCKDGKTFPVEVVAQIIRHEREYLVAVVRDITERKRLERTSQDQADCLRLAMDIAGLAIWDWDILSNTITWSDNCERVKRLPPGSFDGTFQAYQRLVHPEDLPRLLAEIEGALNGRNPYHTEHRIVPPDGEIQWVEGNGAVYRDESGRPIRMVGTVRNITERKRIEQAMRVSEERYARATAVGRVGVWELDVSANAYYGDRNLRTMFGYQPDELSTDPSAWLNLVHPDDHSIAMAHWQRIVRREADEYHYELRMVKKDGAVIWTDVRGHAVCDDDGQVTYVIGATVDITDRKRMEIALRESEERFRVIADTAPALIWMSGLDKKCTYFNQRWLDYTGQTMEQELGDGWAEGVHPEDFDRCVQVYSQAFDRRRPFDMEYRLRKADGQYGWIHDRGAPRVLPDGTFAGYVGACIDITERKRVQENLLRTQFAMDQAVDAVYWIDPQARILYANEAASTMLGYTADEFLRMTVHDLNPDFSPEGWLGWWEEAREKKVISLETSHLAKDGRRIPIDVRVSFLAYGGQEFHCAFVRDISKRKEVEETAHRSFTLLQSVLHTVPIRVFWKDRESRYLGCNQQFALDAGCADPREIVGKIDDELVWHEQAALYRSDDRQVMESACAKLDFDEPGTTPEGKPIWLRTSKVPLRDEQGCVIGVLGVYDDITERKRIDRELRASRERFELAAKASNDGIWDWNILTGEHYWSDRHLELFGLEPGEFIPAYEMWMALVHPDDADRVHRAMRHHLDTREPYDIEVRVRMKDGRYRWFHDRGQAVWDASGHPVRMVGSICDVTERRAAEEVLRNAHAELEERVIERTKQLGLANRSLQEEIAERKRVEEAIRESESRYKLLTEATFDGIAIHDQGVLLEVNAGLERMFGYAPGELIGRSMWDLIAEESRSLVMANMRHGVNGPYEAMGRRNGGTLFPGEVVARPCRYRGKDVRLVAGRDITERKHLEAERFRHTEELERQVAERTAEIGRLESQRAQAERLAALGRLAAGVAHEINNPIAGIKNAFELVKQAVDPAHAQYEFVGMIDREIARVSSIVQNMYQLYRRESGKVETVDLRVMIRDMEALFAKQLHQRQIRLIVEAEPGVEKLDVPRSDLLQVLLNLLTNAIDCSREGGTIRMSVGEEAEGVRIALADQGEGISPEVLPHIFDPFFTTKTEGEQKGMGLGLSISQSLVVAMGGRIDVHTRLGQGSTFSVLLPRDRVVACMPDQTHTNKGGYHV